MPGKQSISELIAKTTVHNDDLFALVDSEETPDETKKITGANMKSEMTSAHAALTTGVHGLGDYVIGVSTSEAVTLYVDAGSGNDANAGTSGSPKATIKGALDALPPIIAHTCTICVRGPQNYAENNVALEFSRFTTLAAIVIKAVNSSDEDMYDNGLATGGGNNYLDDSGASWSANQFNGAYIWIYEGTGAGQIRTISATTATRITVSANWTVNPDATSYYAIGGGATLTGTGAQHIVVTGKTVNLYGFRHTGATSADVRGERFGIVTVTHNYFATSVFGGVELFDKSFGDMRYNYSSATQRTYNCTNLSSCVPRATVFNGGSVGLRLISGGIAQMHWGTTQKNYFLGVTTGIEIDSGGCRNASNQVFSGCTTDINPAVSTTVPQWWT